MATKFANALPSIIFFLTQIHFYHKPHQSQFEVHIKNFTVTDRKMLSIHFEHGSPEYFVSSPNSYGKEFIDRLLAQKKLCSDDESQPDKDEKIS